MLYSAELWQSLSQSQQKQLKAARTTDTAARLLERVRNEVTEKTYSCAEIESCY